MLIRLLYARLRPYRRTVVILLTLQLVQTLATLLLPTLNAAVIDNGVVKGDTDYITGTGVVMVCVALVQVLTASCAVLLSSRTTAGLGRDLRSAVFRRVMHLSAREVGRFGTPTLITRTVNDVQQIQRFTMTVFDVAVSAAIMCVGGMALGLYQDPPLALMLMGLVLVIGVCMAVLLKRLGPSYDLMQRCVDRVGKLLREQISGVRVIRAYVQDGREREKYSRANTDLFDVALRVGRLMAAIPVVLMLAMNALSVALVWFAGRRIDSGDLQLGALNALLSYLALIIMSIIVVSLVFTEAPRARVAASRVREVLETETSVPAPQNPVEPWIVTGDLTLRDVEFGYPGAEVPVLRGIDLSVRPGETVAVLGGTGSGKTTLLNLALRLIDVTAGSVSVSGVDIRDLSPEVLTRTVGFVPQKPYLFSGTIASNLRYGNPEASDEELWHALEVAQARDFVERMTDGLNSTVSQGGSNVSGGQRQRLAIARTLLRKPSVYLLDDCFSALDHGTEAALRTALAKEIAMAPVVLVTQRISTVENADRIVVVDDGRIAGVGTHEELMRDSETYREMALSQPALQEAPGALAGN